MQAATLRKQAATELLARRKARSNLHDFSKYTFAALYPDKEFQDNWHTHLICEHLDRVVAGEIRRLFIFAPPRHLKSEFVSRRFPAYYLGHNPGHHVIAASYAATLARDMSRDVQRIIDSPEYTNLFPGTSLNTRNVRTISGAPIRTVDKWEIVNHNGKYRAAGVGEGITGMGANLLILDDPFKDRAEAESPTYRKARWDWYISTFSTRKVKDAAIVCVLTRWHQDDIAGRLLNSSEAKDWTVLNLPALADPPLYHLDPRGAGEALWPWHMDAAALEKERELVGEYEFSSLYQQRPTPREGGMLNTQRIAVVTTAPEPLRKVRYWDLAVTTGERNDYTVGLLLGIASTGQVYILNIQRARRTLPETQQLITQTAAIDGRTVPVVIEGEKAGMIALDYLMKDPAMAPYTVRKDQPVGDKVARAAAIASRIDGGIVHMVQAPWNRALIDELQAFPTGTHDDQVDALSGAFNYIAKNTQKSTPSWF